MPDLRVEVSSDREDFADISIEGQLTITYDRHLSDYQDDFPGENSWQELTNNQDGDKEWSIDLGDDFYGGECTLDLRTAAGEELEIEREFVFHIRGENPDEDTVENYIEGQIDVWYSTTITSHESGEQHGRTYLQFNEVGDLGPSNSDFRGHPNWGTPDGWGIMQLDPPPNRNVLWNWQDNVDGGIDVIEDKRRHARSFLRDDYALAIYYAYEQGGSIEDLPNMPDTQDLDRDYSNVEFEEPDWDFDWDYEENPAEYVNERTESPVSDKDIEEKLVEYIEVNDSEETTYLDAEAIKLYNGGRFIEFNRDVGNWEVTEYATWEDEDGNVNYNYYVDDICEEYNDEQ